MAEDVQFADFVSNPFVFMRRASAFVLSSAWEGLPTVLIEELACGCPMVGTDCPSGPAEILVNGALGPFVPVGDDRALAGAIARTLDDPPRRERLRQRAASFSAGAVAEEYERLILGSRRGS